MTTSEASARGRPRRTQEERRESTRRALLEATVDCLVRQGYARTTTTEIAALAGVSQGALFKHFETKAALLSAAVEYLFAEVVEGYRRDFAALSTERVDLDAGFDLLWNVFTSPRLQAAFELYVAARTDGELAAALHPVVGKHRAVLVEEARKLMPPRVASMPSFPAIVDLLMCAMEGLVIERYGAGDVTGPALSVLRALMLGFVGGANGTR